MVAPVIVGDNDRMRLGGDADDLAGGKKDPIGDDGERERTNHDGTFGGSNKGGYHGAECFK